MSLHPQACWRGSLLERAAGEVGVGELLWGEKLAHIVVFKVTGTTCENIGMGWSWGGYCDTGNLNVPHNEELSLKMSVVPLAEKH